MFCCQIEQENDSLLSSSSIVKKYQRPIATMSPTHSGFPTLEPAIICKVNVGDVNPLGMYSPFQIARTQFHLTYKSSGQRLIQLSRCHSHRFHTHPLCKPLTHHHSALVAINLIPRLTQSSGHPHRHNGDSRRVFPCLQSEHRLRC